MESTSSSSTSSSYCDTLNREFGINESISFSLSSKGLEMCTLSLLNGATAQIYLHGAHLTSFKTETGREILFVSKKSNYLRNKAIRGGVPVIFPQFGPGKLPQHGFARDRAWNVISTAKQDHKVWITFELKDNEATRQIWPHSFVLRLTVTLLEFDQLTKQSRISQKLEVKNTSLSCFEFTTALHTYYAIDNIRSTTVSPVENLIYFDKPTGQKLKQENSKISFQSETDKVYYNTPPLLLIQDNQTSPPYTVFVEKEGFTDTVVWNIWEDKIKGMSDMSAEEWEKYVCVESGTIANPVVLESEQVWEATQIFGLL